MNFTKKMAYNDNETQLFIRLYKERPVLWNTQDASYTRKEARVQAVREIADMMGRTEHEVHVKINSLRTAFARELKREAVRVKSGRGDFMSKWKYAVDLEFLRDFVIARERSRNIYSQDLRSLGNQNYANGSASEDSPSCSGFIVKDMNSEPEEDMEDLQESHQDLLNSVDFDELAPVFGRNSDHKRFKRDIKSEICLDDFAGIRHSDELLPKAPSYAVQPRGPMMPVQSEEDIFGCFVANELKQVPNDEDRRRKRKLITQILFDDMPTTLPTTTSNLTSNNSTFTR